MVDFFANLFDTSDFPARWQCGNWTELHGWFHIVSDTAVFGAYMAIPLVLLYFVRRRPDIPFPKVFWLFGLFIFACGTTHLMDALVFQWPAYRLAGVLKFTTAVASWATVLALIPITPQVLALRSPRELEREIVERKRAERELAQKHRRLQEAERAKSEFFALVSHELRTPLTLILAPVESLLSEEDGLPDPRQQQNLETVHNNAVRLLQMVTGLLDFSKLEAGKIEPHREAANVTGLTQTILKDFGPTLGQKNLELTFQSLPEEICVEIDRYLYERIAFNLVSNAVKFTPEGGRISVILGWEQGRLRLTVNDTGIGIPEHEQPRLFERFRQVEGSPTRRFEGTGLGLALVKEFAELLDGSVSVVSRPGEGSTFTVQVEAAACDQTAAAFGSDGTGADGWDGTGRTVMQQQYAPRPAVSDESNGGVSSADANDSSESAQLPEVVLAEDNVELASYMAMLLRGTCRTRVARDGEEALELVRRHRPDLVLTDVMMPKKDGFSLCRDIRAERGLSNTSILLVTALTHREALLKGWEAGADDYLHKPFHPLELTTRVKSILALVQERRRGEQALRAAYGELEQRVRERTSELSAANRELERINRALEQEIADRRQAEEALRRSEEQYRRIVETAHEGIWMLDADAKVTYANRRIADLLGYTPDELLQRSLWDFMDADGQRDARQFWERRRQGIAEHHDFRFRRADGSELWAIVSTRPVYDDQGRFAGSLKMLTDITERKQAEDRLRLLAEAGEVLSSSLEFESTLKAVARLAVPQLADWCVVDMVDEQGATRRLAVEHIDSGKAEFVYELQRRYPPDPQAPRGVPAVLRSGRPEYAAEIPDALLVEAAQDEEHLRILRELGLKSYMCVPLIVRGQTLGALSFAAAESGRRYDEADLALAEELARRAAVAVDNARLFRAAQQELSERRQSEAELRRREEQLRFILEAAHVGTWDWDIQSGVVQWSDNMEDVHGAAPGSFDGSFEGSFRDIAPEDREMVQQAIAQAVEQGEQYHVEYRLAAPEGPSRWLEAKGRVIFEDDRPVRMAGICTDVTERRRLQERFRLAVEASPSGAVMINDRGLITLVNSQTENLFGYDRDELIGQPIELLVPYRFRERHPGYRDDFFTSPKARPMGGGRDLFGLHKNGREIPVEIGLNPIETEEGLFVLSSIVDITERKRAEEALRQVNENLQQTNQELEQFVYTVSHDLKSPLVTTMGFIGLLREDIAAGRTEEVEDALIRIERASHRMSDLIEDLLQLSRVRRMRYEPEEIDVSDLLHEMSLDLAGRLQSAGVQLEIEQSLPRVVADRMRLTEVFENLLVNAIKYGCRPGVPPKIVVGSRRTPRGVEFFVRDNGPGIDPKYHEKVFALFQRLDTTQEGTGIGLAIVAKIMQVHGGRAWVESQPGDGATFCVLFPAESVAS